MVYPDLLKHNMIGVEMFSNDVEYDGYADDETELQQARSLVVAMVYS
jgi:hypothetical protein